MPDSLFSLNGRTALVTGGATGIGHMAAQGLMAAGVRVLIASRKGAACVAAADALNALGLPGQAEGFAGDVGTEAGVSALVSEVTGRTATLDILINNAGRSWGAPLGSYPYDAWDKLLSVNVTGLFHLTQGLLPALQAAASDDAPARIVNIGSVMGEIPMGERVYAYAASKAAVHHLTRVLARDLAGHRITVNALAPGPFVSNMTAFVTADERQRARVAAEIPLGRVGTPEDIAGCLSFLCSRAGAYVTGAIIPVSGGMNIETGPDPFERAME